MLAATLLFPFAFAPAMGEEPPRLLDPVTLQGTAGPISHFDSAALADGSIAVAYADDGSQLSSLRAAVYLKDGAVVVAPVPLDSSAGSLNSLGVSSSADGTAAVEWVGAGGIGFATITHAGAGAIAFVQTPGFSPSDCKIAAESQLFVLACSMIDTGNPSAVSETYLFKLDRLGAVVSGPLLVTPADATYSMVSGIVVDGAGDAWIAYREPDALSAADFSTYLTLVDPSGAPSSSSGLLASTHPASAPVALVPLSGSEGAVMAGLARESRASGNAEIVLRTFVPNSTTPIADVVLTSVASIPKALSIGAIPGSSGERYSIEWMEQRPADQPVGGPNVVRPVIAIGDRQLSLSLAPWSLPTLVAERSDFVGGSADFLTADGGLILYRFAFAAPPTTTVPGPEPSPVPTVVVGIIVGALIPLALVEERLRWGLIAIFLPFYARLRGEKIMLDNMRRGAIVQLIKDNPGIRFRQLSRRTGIAQGALEHHLRVLQFHGFVLKESVGREVRFYLEGKNPIAEEPFAELRERILSEIRVHPGVAHSTLAKSMGVKWATLLYHLEALHGDGQVRYRSRRGRRRYWLQEPGEN